MAAEKGAAHQETLSEINRLTKLAEAARDSIKKLTDAVSRQRAQAKAAEYESSLAREQRLLPGLKQQCEAAASKLAVMRWP